MRGTLFDVGMLTKRGEVIVWNSTGDSPLCLAPEKGQLVVMQTRGAVYGACIIIELTPGIDYWDWRRPSDDVKVYGMNIRGRICK